MSQQFMMTNFLNIIFVFISALEKYVSPAIFLFMRFYVGIIFFRSGMTKFDSPDSARFLFENEYLTNWESNKTQNIWGIDINFPVPTLDFILPLATYGEIILGIFLVIGLMSRISAMGIFTMSIIIETFVYPGTLEHTYWMIITALVIAQGPGKLSIDHGIRLFIIKNYRINNKACNVQVADPQTPLT